MIAGAAHQGRPRLLGAQRAVTAFQPLAPPLAGPTKLVAGDIQQASRILFGAQL